VNRFQKLLDDGQLLPNLVKEGLPTIQELVADQSIGGWPLKCDTSRNTPSFEWAFEFASRSKHRTTRWKHEQTRSLRAKVAVWPKETRIGEPRYGENLLIWSSVEYPAELPTSDPSLRSPVLSIARRAFVQGLRRGYRMRSSDQGLEERSQHSYFTAVNGFTASAHGKLVTFGVTRGCIAVASPMSSITWVIAP